jgi:hypothetical protein
MLHAAFGLATCAVFGVITLQAGLDALVWVFGVLGLIAAVDLLVLRRRLRPGGGD